MDSIDWIEVYFSGENSECSKIRRAIINDGISAVVSTFGYEEKLGRPRLGFCCQVLQECRDCTHKHLCLIPVGKDRPTVVTCSESSQVKQCSSQQLCWFDAQPSAAGIKFMHTCCYLEYCVGFFAFYDNV